MLLFLELRVVVVIVAATFKVCIERRYKLNKILRELQENYESRDDLKAMHEIEQALVRSRDSIPL